MQNHVTSLELSKGIIINKKMKYFLFIFVLVLVGCTNIDQTERVLVSQGYTDIQITGYRVFGCSEDDDFSTGFTAKMNNKTVSGVVCSGILKGATTRLD